MTIPALIRTRFLKIYCPSSVGAYGIWVKTSDGNKKIGVIVPSICTKRSSKTKRLNFPRIKPKPMRDSQVARRIMDTFSGIRPKVRRLIVRVAKSWAELKSGKNFNTPNQKNTMPKLTLNTRMP
jgi:hypothetical protein